MTKRILTIAMLATLFLNACKEAQKQESGEVQKTETGSEAKAEVFGTYEGSSPGANSLIKETLTLNPDNTFTKTLVYVDKGNEAFTDKGTFKVDGEKVVLDVEHDKEGGYYKIFNDHLLQLDITGKEITGENPDGWYIMKKVKK